MSILFVLIKSKYLIPSSTNSAGSHSDVFVVPNLSIMYEVVYLVYWSNSICSAEKVDGEFPTTVLFDVGSDGTEPALTFFSREHIDNVKIPDLQSSINASLAILERVEKREIICCSADEESGSCLGKSPPQPLIKCGTRDLEEEKAKKNLLEAALEGWNTALKKSKDNFNAAIGLSGDARNVDGWFDDIGAKSMYKDSDTSRGFTDTLEIKDFDAELAPDTLINENALKPLEASKTIINMANTNQKETKVKGTKRIQFGGDAGSYEISLDMVKSTTSFSQDCNNAVPAIVGGAALGLSAFTPVAPLIAGAMVVSSAIAGCNFGMSSDISIGDIDLFGAAFGIGVETSVGAGKY